MLYAPSNCPRRFTTTAAAFNMPFMIITFFFALVATVAYRCSKIGRRSSNHHPGPPTLPLIGNLHLMPKGNPHLQFQKWADEYGPIYSLMLGTKVMVVLNTDQAVKDLLDKRSGIYSSRPDMYISRIASGGLRFTLMVRCRVAIHNFANANGSLTVWDRNTARHGA